MALKGLYFSAAILALFVINLPGVVGDETGNTDTNTIEGITDERGKSFQQANSVAVNIGRARVKRKKAHYKVLSQSLMEPNNAVLPPKDTFETDAQYYSTGLKSNYEVILKQGKFSKGCDDEDDCDPSYSGSGDDDDEQRIRGLSPFKEESPLPIDSVETNDQSTDDFKRNYQVIVFNEKQPKQLEDTFDADDETRNLPRPKYKSVSISMSDPQLLSKECDDEDDCDDNGSGDDEGGRVDPEYPDAIRGLSPIKEELNVPKDTFEAAESIDSKPKYKRISITMFDPKQQESNDDDLDDYSNSPDANRIYSPAETPQLRDELLLPVPFFLKTSFRTFPPLGETTTEYIDVEMRIKPVKDTGILLYNGWKPQQIGDFISLTLQKGFVELSFNCGSGTVQIRTMKAIAMNKWHNIKFYRSERLGHLTVNSDIPSLGFSPGPHTMMSLHENLYIGGVAHDIRHEVTMNVGIHRPYIGYIQNLRINGKTLKLMSLANEKDPCFHKPCQNGGHCVIVGDDYSCSCSVYYKGKHCEKKINLAPVNFNTESYIHFNQSALLKILRKPNSAVSFFLKTTDSNGLLIFEAQTDDYNFKRFVIVSLHDGTILLSYDVGYGKILVKSLQIIDDGHWHKVTIGRSKTSCLIAIDDIHTTKFKALDFYYQDQSNVDVYIGAPPETSEKTNSMFRSGFNGCLKKFLINNQYLDFNDAVSAKDTRDCNAN